jgi:hypothetical protein
MSKLACSAAIVAVAGSAFATEVVNVQGVTKDYSDDYRDCCVKLGNQPDYRRSAGIADDCQARKLVYIEGSSSFPRSSYCQAHEYKGIGYKYWCDQAVEGKCRTRD